MAELTNPFLVVIAGGSGTRFWPKSTADQPKQLLNFTPKGPSLLKQTLDRFESFVPKDQKLIVTTERLGKQIKSQNLGAEVLCEPEGRNTAACIYWAAKQITKKNPKAVMMVMPADHWISQPEALVATLKSACAHATLHDDLITIAIQPTRAETGYGYLKVEAPQSSQNAGQLQKVQAFVEKPNAKKAQEFFEAKNYYWNAGMFVWRADVILQAFDDLLPEMKTAWEAADGNPTKAYPNMPAISVDYGILEKAKNVVTLPVECGWDDLGSWPSLEGLADTLSIRQGSNVVSAGEVLSIESNGNIVDAPNTFIALLGVDDLIIVQTQGTLMIAKKDRAQDLKLIVNETKKIRPDLV